MHRSLVDGEPPWRLRISRHVLQRDIDRLHPAFAGTAAATQVEAMAGLGVVVTAPPAWVNQYRDLHLVITEDIVMPLVVDARGTLTATTLLVRPIESSARRATRKQRKARRRLAREARRERLRASARRRERRRGPGRRRHS